MDQVDLSIVVTKDQGVYRVGCGTTRKRAADASFHSTFTGNRNEIDYEELKAEIDATIEGK